MKKLTSITIGVIAVCTLVTSAALAAPKLKEGQTAQSYCEKHAKSIRQWMSTCSSQRTLGRCVPEEKRQAEIKSCLAKFR